MENLIKMSNSSESVFYAVLNPENNTVVDISPALLKQAGVTDYKNKQLRDIVGCSFDHTCNQSAVNIDMTKTDKAIQIVDCKHLKKQFLVIKYLAEHKGSLKHFLLFTDTDSFSGNFTLINNLDHIISHEINNAINAHQLINSTLMDDLTHGELASFEELLELSNQNGQVISKIISLYREIKNAITSTSSTESPSTKTCVILEEAVNNNISRIKKRNLNVNFDKPEHECKQCKGTVQLNKNLLYLLFSNLINNASKYAPENSTINITFMNEEGKSITIIENEGNIPKHLDKAFFSKFTKGKDSSGSGFGTYCCKLITELFKGSIDMKNADNVVTITVTLPT